MIKKQIIIASSILLSILFVMIIVVALSSTPTKIPEDINIENQEFSIPITFYAKNQEFRFTETQYKDLLKIFELADIQTMRFKLSSDTLMSATICVGIIDQYKFHYKYTIPHHHFMMILDTISSNEYYIINSGSFAKSLMFYFNDDNYDKTTE